MAIFRNGEEGLAILGTGEEGLAVLRTVEEGVGNTENWGGGGWQY